MEQQPMGQMGMGEVTSDDKLWAALAYVFSPLVPVILLFMEDKKNRPFIRAHNGQALVMGVVLIVAVPVIAFFTFGCGTLIWVLMLYWAYKAYQGEYVTIPAVSDFVKNQGWA